MIYCKQFDRKEENCAMENKNLPLVSVVIPTYNRIKTLPVSISSVLNQTYRNLEVLIIDDGSDDGTEEYIKSIHDSRVKYRKSETNMGPSAARNIGARLARGEFLAFQDSDDEWRSDKLEKQMEFMLDNNNISLVYCEFGMYQEGKLVGFWPSREISSLKKTDDIFSYLLVLPLISTQTMVLKRKEFMEEGGFNENLKAYEDFEFSLRFSRKHRIGFVGEDLVRLNISPNSVSKRFGERIHTQFYMVREMLDALREKQLLWDKMRIILNEAEKLKCHDVFIEELKQLSEELKPGEEREKAAVYLEEIEYSKENYLMKVGICDHLLKLKQKVLEIYLGLYEKKMRWSDDLGAVLREILESVNTYGEIFAFPQEVWVRQNAINQKINIRSTQEIERLYLLTDLVELLEMVEKHIQYQL